MKIEELRFNYIRILEILGFAYSSRDFMIRETCSNFYQSFQIATLTQMFHVVILHGDVQITNHQDIFKLRCVQVQVPTKRFQV